MWGLDEVGEWPFFNAKTLYLEKHRVGLRKGPASPAVNQVQFSSL